MSNALSASETQHRCGFVGLLGWTNVGKSTLVNKLTGMKIAITADSPQTTRHRLIGIIQGPGYQIALTDTPGIHTAKNELSNRMIRTTWGTMASMDVVLWMVFPDKPAEIQLKGFQERIQSYRAPVVVVINKIDSTRKDILIPLMQDFEKLFAPAAIVPISALNGENIDTLLKIIVDYLPFNEPIFPVDQVTDQPERLIVAEFIREQVIENTFQEMPHVIAVEIDLFRRTSSGLIEIIATIYVEKASQKGIVIGAGGQMLKKIGMAARHEIASFLESRVDLRLWIKVNPKWRNDPKRLTQLGFDKL